MNRTTIIVIGVALIAFFSYVSYKGMQRDPHLLTDSPLIGKQAPDFKLAVLDKPDGTFSPADMKGQVWMLNVWATWCVACRDEHPRLVRYARSAGAVPVVGLNHKEIRGDFALSPDQLIRIVPDQKTVSPQEIVLADQRSSDWLSKHENPYALVIMDIDGRVGLDYGLTGVPETYVIDKQGIIRYKEVGVVTDENLKNKILPLIAELQAKS
ncbi:MAG: redoxin family protein [Gallionellaceae bacterium]|jgi:cytochrome c biogenesis protein CcmG/thiol:disulfide interchange protein DsbE|nr:redoxin family protein [Gallionellaceae bacterium]